jgi:hypothetical protein
VCDGRLDAVIVALEYDIPHQALCSCKVEETVRDWWHIDAEEELEEVVNPYPSMQLDLVMRLLSDRGCERMGPEKECFCTANQRQTLLETLVADLILVQVKQRESALIVPSSMSACPRLMASSRRNMVHDY